MQFFLFCFAEVTQHAYLRQCNVCKLGRLTCIKGKWLHYTSMNGGYLSSSIKLQDGFIEVDVAPQLSVVCFWNKAKKNACADWPFKRFSPIPGYRNNNTETYNKFGHLTSLSERYQPRNFPKCGTNITRRAEPLVWVITLIHSSVQWVLELLDFVFS